MDAIELIQAERQRQIEKGYDATHDDKHTDGSIAEAAASVALYGCGYVSLTSDAKWPNELRKRVRAKYTGQPLRSLVIAGALIVAEIERIQRLDDLSKMNGERPYAN